MDELGSLVALAQGGDLDAYAEIVRRFQNMAYGYAFSTLGDFHLAEDAAQEAFIQAYRDLAKLREPLAFPGWFRTVVRKHCDRMTRRRRVPTGPLEAAAGAASDDVGPAEAAERRERHAAVMAAIRSLPERERTATALYYINGYSHAEIAEFLDVPATTVNNRLHTARERLKERMTTMVETTLRDNALPDDFASRLLMFPFPRIEPPVKITDLPGQAMQVRCVDAQCYFSPLVEQGVCDWTFYDRPDGRLTGVDEWRVIGASKRRDGVVLRVWSRHTDVERDNRQEWRETHILIENDTWRWVDVDRTEAGDVAVSERRRPGHPSDPAFEPVPMDLAVGMKWGGFAGGEAVGVAQVTIGDRSWRCLKVVTVAQEYKTRDGTPSVYAEWYVAETGRTVFFRRYNGPGYREPDQPTSFESLEGMLEVQWGGVTFRHSYDCIPDIALAGESA